MRSFSGVTRISSCLCEVLCLPARLTVVGWIKSHMLSGKEPHLAPMMVAVWFPDKQC